MIEVQVQLLQATRLNLFPTPVIFERNLTYRPCRCSSDRASHKVSSKGYELGSLLCYITHAETADHGDDQGQPAGVGVGSFYSYAYPEPAGFRDRPATPGSYFDAALGEFILPYDAVAAAAEPYALLLDFLSTTYAAAAETGGWDRSALECPFGVPGRVRPI